MPYLVVATYPREASFTSGISRDLEVAKYRASFSGPLADQ